LKQPERNTNPEIKEKFKKIAGKLEEANENSKTIDIVILTFRNKPVNTKYEHAFLPEEIVVENLMPLRDSQTMKIVGIRVLQFFEMAALAFLIILF
jgi:hypothetical protein